MFNRLSRQMLTDVSNQVHTSSFRRSLVLVLLTVFGYLFHVCVMPHFSILGVTPNLLYAIIGIVTVAYGKLRAFWVGMVFGLLMEIMLPSIPFMNLALYSLTTLFCSFAFADKPLKTLEYERATNRRRKELPAWLRTVLCAALNVTVYEVINVTYIYLGGSPLNLGHFGRALLDVVLTTLLTLVLLFPLRRLIFGRKQAQPVLQAPPVIFKKA